MLKYMENLLTCAGCPETEGTGTCKDTLQRIRERQEVHGDYCPCGHMPEWSINDNDILANYYQAAAKRTVNDDLFDKPEGLLVNAALGLTGEAGEVADQIKKHLFQGHDLDREEMVKELGDVMWYIALMATVLDVNLSMVMRKNIHKLEERYPLGFDADRSRNRPE